MAQARMGDALIEPIERDPLERPAESDPLSFELDGEDQADEEECCPAVPRELERTVRPAGGSIGMPEGSGAGEDQGGRQQSQRHMRPRLVDGLMKQPKMTWPSEC